MPDDNRILIAVALYVVMMALILAFAMGGTLPAKAQQRTLYDRSGRAAATIIENRNTRTIYGADGRVLARETTDTQGTTSIYDRAGNKIGTTKGGNRTAR